MPVTGEWFSGAPTRGGPPKLDTSVPHQARVYNYWLGGKDNFAADRELAEQAIAANPGILAGVRANRAFLARAVRYLVTEAGIRQFLDIGTGLPTANNTHEVAQAAEPLARVVYVDNDPIVLTHARALLTSTPEGATAYLDADLRDLPTILALAARTLDLRQPVAVMLLAILQVVGDDEDPWELVSQLVGAVPPGSYLVISHPASDIRPASMAEMASRLNRGTPGAHVTFRTRDAVAKFFSGLELVEPGLVTPPEWRPEGGHPGYHQDTAHCGVARKPAQANVPAAAPAPSSG
jgi:SAM-dependent methyltransferase